VAGFAALGAWPTAGYRRWGVAGGAGGAAVGGAALVAKLGAAVLLSAACLVACIPAGVEAAGRQVTHRHYSTGTAPPSEHVRYICRGEER
jgi:hypothetical protein